mmetsp:Transcript_59832/g.142522  ORF Transcript_59832/g.142522 Transcript_59832/m.142522 type:complete len:287 (-) Transcript_59832:112-972(-)
MLSGPVEVPVQHATILADVSQNGFALRRVPVALQGDREIVLAAVTHNGLALQYAHVQLQADREIALTAVAENGCALRFVHEHLQADRDVVLAAVSENGEALEFADEVLRGDRGVAMSAVRQNWRALKYVGADLRADHDIVLAAAQQNSSALNKTPAQVLDRDELSEVARATEKYILRVTLLSGRFCHVSCEGMQCANSVKRLAAELLGIVITPDSGEHNDEMGTVSCAAEGADWPRREERWRLLVDGDLVPEQQPLREWTGIRVDAVNEVFLVVQGDWAEACTSPT